MKDLLAFLISEITGAKSTEDFTVSEDTVEGKTILNVVSKPNIIGLIIGKEGKTIKNIRKIVSVRAVLENKSINISVNPME